MDPLISIIVPIYNVEKYLEKCVNSIVSQSYKNLEIILVDDGSQDKCPELCDNFAKTDSRIKVIHKSNGGLSSARNVGIKFASGDYIALVDSDDYIDSNMYQDMLRLLIENNADLCICNYEYVDDKDCLYPITFSSPIIDEILNKEEIYKKLNQPVSWYYITSVNKLYKKDVIIGDVFPIGRLHEDEFSIHHIFGRCEKIVCTEKKYYYYVQRTGSIMSQRNILSKIDKADALLDRYLYYYTNSIIGAEKWFKSAYGILLSILKTHEKVNSSYKIRLNRLFRKVFTMLIKQADLRAFKLFFVFLIYKIGLVK